MKTEQSSEPSTVNGSIDNIIQTLGADAFWMVNKAISRQIGIENAALLSELISKFRYWRERGQLQPDGSFFMTQADIIEVMGVSERAAKRMTKSIQECGAVTVKKRGTPAKNHWTINWNFLSKMVSGGLTGQYGTVPTGEAGSVPTGEAGTVPTYTKNNDKQQNKEKEIAEPSGSLYKSVVDLIAKAHETLTREKLTFEGQGKAYGVAVKHIMRQAGKGTDAELLERIRQKVRLYYKLAKSEAQTGKTFYSLQGITPLSIRQHWNKLVDAKRAGSLEVEKPKVNFGELTEQQCAAVFGNWQKTMSAAELREILPAEVWEEWQTDKNGFAPALLEIILAFKRRGQC